MLTDAPPRKVNRAGFLESDQTRTLDLSQDGSLLTITKSIESAMKRHKPRENLKPRRKGLKPRYFKCPSCILYVLLLEIVQVSFPLRGRRVFRGAGILLSVFLHNRRLCTDTRFAVPNKNCAGFRTGRFAG